MDDISATVSRNPQIAQPKQTDSSTTETNQFPDATETDEYSDPDFSESDQESEDSNSPTAEDMIFRQSLTLECQIPRSSSKIIAVQSDFNPRQRETAVKRVIQLSYHFQLTSDTLYNAVCYFDILLSSIVIPVSDFELFATVCYWIAAKFDTKHQPSVEKLTEFAGTTYTAEQFKTLELQIIEALGFQLCFPTTKVFLRSFLENGPENATIYHVANVFLEIALIEFMFVDVRPSVIAASAVAVAWAALGNNDAARETIRISSCTNLKLLTDAMKAMIGYGERISGAKDGTRCRAVFQAMDFIFDSSALF
jgi:hypothetical protein